MLELLKNNKCICNTQKKPDLLRDLSKIDIVVGTSLGHPYLAISSVICGANKCLDDAEQTSVCMIETR